MGADCRGRKREGSSIVNFISAPTCAPGWITRARIIASMSSLNAFSTVGRPPCRPLPKPTAFSAAVIFVAAGSSSALCQKKYDTGATDTEIKIGNIMPYGGRASAYGVTGRTEAAYFRKINAEGGINGRKIDFISYDDAYSGKRTSALSLDCLLGVNEAELHFEVSTRIALQKR
jgi:Periplasmic binding protein